MPDIIRPATVDSTVVVTISAVADQSTLNAVSPTVSATVDGLAATITAWAWKVNGATTGITGPTTATPSYTPTTAGAKVITVDVTIDGVVYSSLPEIFTVGPTALSVSIAAVSDQLTLAAATLDSTATGGVTPYTYAWTVNGATTGLSSSTAADPTYTPTGAGTPTAVVTVTDAAGQTAKATRTFTVGDTDGRVQTHAVDWTAAANAGTHTGATVTRDGLAYIFGSGSSSSAVATEGVGLVMDDGAAGSIGCDWAGSDSGSGTITQADDVVIYVAYDGGISGSDTVTLSWLNATGVERFGAEASYYTSAHHVSCKLRRSSTYTFTFKATTSASRIMALRVIKGVLAEVRYSTTAYSGTWPVFSTMTKVFATRTSNVVTAQDLNSTDAADKIDPSTSIGRLAISGANRTIAATAIFTRTIG